MANLFKDHPLMGGAAALGATTAIGFQLNDIYQFFNAGLSNAMWSTLGLATFFIMVLGMLWAGPKAAIPQTATKSVKELISFEPPDFNAWSKLEEFTLMEAACLWGEVAPVSNPTMMLPDARPYYAMLRQAIQTKKIPAYIRQKNGTKTETIEPGPSVAILRGSLEFLAKERDEKPQFLFPDEEVSPHAWMRK